MPETADRDANHPLRARLDDVFGRYQRLRSDVDDIQRRLAEVRISAESEDGLIRATVGPRGQLLDLRLDRRIYRDMDAGRLSHAIVETTARAAELAAAEVQRLMAGYLPVDSGPMRYLRDDDLGSLLHRQDAAMREADPGHG
ncbi:YbaB/EbfC family nucleoid-associated protein [Pseudosporangium ferrugineum]|uniref:DNA-binding protein YbaB n=1 Tax=Pseudosporangium ferrugineum TaxID=439699 RepID=A0A2T0S1F6_9ACTN|nr:YbaB/EbfC family nucleoid-associated protein [Pseudosporangium ferrugineum]PRY27230.1 DNA-binding protein YbaB [Pseudosporangium ferrugineum]